MKEEKNKLYFLPMLRLIEMIPYSEWEESNRVERYVKKLIESLYSEGYVVDAKIIDEKLRYYKGENVAMAVMDKSLEN